MNFVRLFTMKVMLQVLFNCSATGGRYRNLKLFVNVQLRCFSLNQNRKPYFFVYWIVLQSSLMLHIIFRRTKIIFKIFGATYWF